MGKLSIFLIGFSKILTLGTMTTIRDFYQSFTSNAQKSGSNMNCFISSVCDLFLETGVLFETNCNVFDYVGKIKKCTWLV